jgi:hypothetical protein
MLIEIFSWFNLILTSAKKPTTRVSTWDDTDSVAIRSPTRSTLALLRSAALPIEICQPGPAAASPGEAVNKNEGISARRVRQGLHSGAACGMYLCSIPIKAYSVLQARLRKFAPDEAVALHDAMFALNS